MKYPKFILIVILIIFISTNNFIFIAFAEDGPLENSANQVINFENESLPNKIIVSVGELFEKLKELGVTVTNGVIKAVKSVVSELKTRVFRIALRKGEDNVVGSGIIPAHATNYRVNNSLIEANSKIFVSFTSDMGNKTWNISEKVPGSGFTIKLSDVASEPLSFDYWIILVKEEGGVDEYAQVDPNQDNNVLPAEIKNKYQLLNNGALKRVAKDDPRDRIEVFIGNRAEITNFEPTLTIARWDDEVDFTLKPKAFNDVPLKDQGLRFEGEKIIFETPKMNFEMYEYTEGEGGYKYIWYLNEKPATNKVFFQIETSGLDFFYQPPLTQEYQSGYSEELKKEIVVSETQVKDLESNVLVERPENVVGSYAVYHQTKGGLNDINDKEYRAGKAFHIFRPHIIDAKGNETWGILNIDVTNGIYSVEIPQEFLDKAVYPIKSNDTIGYTTTGGTVDGAMSNTFLATTKTQANASGGTLTEIQAAVYDASGDHNIKLAVYNDSAGVAGSLVADSYPGEILITKYIKPTQDSQWMSSTNVSGTIVANNYYWLAANQPDSSVYHCKDTVATQYAYPTSDISNASWTMSAGATLWPLLDEEPYSDADYVMAQWTNDGDAFVVKLGSLTDPNVHTGHILRIRAGVEPQGSEHTHLKYELLQGTTVIGDSGVIELPFWSNPFNAYSFTLSEAEAANITDYTDLRVRVTDVTGAPASYTRVSWVRLEVPLSGGSGYVSQTYADFPTASAPTTSVWGYKYSIYATYAASPRQYAYPTSDISNNGWGDGWGTTSIYNKVDEEPYSDADFVYSLYNTDGIVGIVQLGSLVDPGVHTEHTLRVRMAGPHDTVIKYELLQGTTVIHSSGNFSTDPDGYPDAFDFTLTEGEAANITDYTDLRVRITAVTVSHASGYHAAACYWIRLETPLAAAAAEELIQPIIIQGD